MPLQDDYLVQNKLSKQVYYDEHHLNTMNHLTDNRRCNTYENKDISRSHHHFLETTSSTLKRASDQLNRSHRSKERKPEKRMSYL